MTHQTPATNPPLDAIVREQAAILRDLTALSPRQADAVTRRDQDALDALLEQRQTLIVRLAAIASVLTARSAELVSLAASVTAAGRAVARDLAETASLWSALAASDSSDLAALRTQRDEMAQELASLNRTGRAAGAYAGPTGRAFFQDTEA